MLSKRHQRAPWGWIDQRATGAGPFERVAAALASSHHPGDHRRMDAASGPHMDIAFEGAVIEWRGPAPFFFIAIPARHLGEISYAAREASYGCGCVPVAATIAGVSFDTSLIPKNGGYLLPLKAAVRAQAGMALGDEVRVHLRVPRTGA